MNTLDTTELQLLVIEKDEEIIELEKELDLLKKFILKCLSAYS